MKSCSTLATRLGCTLFRAFSPEQFVGQKRKDVTVNEVSCPKQNKEETQEKKKLPTESKQSAITKKCFIALSSVVAAMSIVVGIMVSRK